MSARVLVMMLALLCLVVSWSHAAEELTWNLVTTWADGTPFTKTQRQDTMYSIYVGSSPSSMTRVKSDVRRPPVALVDIKEITMGQYIGVDVVLPGVPPSPLTIIRYDRPGAVEQPRIKVSPFPVPTEEERTLTWPPVVQYTNGELLTPEDQRNLRYRVFRSDSTGALTMAIENLVQPFIWLGVIPHDPAKPFLAVAAYLASFQGQASRPIPRNPSLETVQP